MPQRESVEDSGLKGLSSLLLFDILIKILLIIAQNLNRVIGWVDGRMLGKWIRQSESLAERESESDRARERIRASGGEKFDRARG